MFARFKKFLEPIERPYCYLLLVTCYHWGWCFWETDHVKRPYCYLLLVTCYHWGWCFWETDHIERPYCYLLLVTCYHWGWCFWATEQPICKGQKLCDTLEPSTWVSQ